MDLSAIAKKQIDSDERRGFPVRFETENEQYSQIINDLVGLVGEVGEFANEIKKVGLGLTNPNYKGPTLQDISPHLREELADVAIYVIRLSALLDVDLEQSILSKMEINDERYRDLER